MNKNNILEILDGLKSGKLSIIPLENESQRKKFLLLNHSNWKSVPLTANQAHKIWDEFQERYNIPFEIFMFDGWENAYVIPLNFNLDIDVAQKFPSSKILSLVEEISKEG